MEDDGSYCALYAGSSAYRRKPVASFRDLNLASINRLISSQALIVSRYNLSIHRRRIKTEEKAKVVTVVRGMYLNATLTIKQQDDLNKSFLKTFFLVGWWLYGVVRTIIHFFKASIPSSSLYFILFILFFRIILVENIYLVRQEIESIPSPKQQQRPLLAIFSFWPFTSQELLKQLFKLKDRCTVHCVPCCWVLKA